MKREQFNKLSPSSFSLKGHHSKKGALIAHILDPDGYSVAKVLRRAGDVPGVTENYHTTWFSERARKEFENWVPDTLSIGEGLEALELNLKFKRNSSK